jgi:hypothetical protein
LQQFKLYYSNNSEYKKFKRWLRNKTNKINEKDKSIIEIAEKKYGKIDDFTDYKKIRTTKLVNAIYNYSPSYFMDKSEKVYFKHEPFGKEFFSYVLLFLFSLYL